jgi:hypothetical protein
MGNQMHAGPPKILSVHLTGNRKHCQSAKSLPLKQIVAHLRTFEAALTVANFAKLAPKD